jgi:hypothetical protein
MDKFIEQELIPQYTRGEKRSGNPEYGRLTRAMRKAKTQGDVAQYERLRQERLKVPYGDPNDPDYRRLKYVRYADDFLLGFAGPQAEAEEVKRRIGEFLQTIGLTMSEEKTLITHATGGRARFLGYEVYMAKGDDQRKGGKRSINGTPMLAVPQEATQRWIERYTRGGKPHHRTELIDLSDYDIIYKYGIEFQGLVNYYIMAHNVSRVLYEVKWVAQQSLVKTLALKHKQKATWVYRKYYRKAKGNTPAHIVVEVPREGKKPLIARFGDKPIRHNKWATIQDKATQIVVARNEVITRLLADTCEICGSTEDARVHHIRKLKELQKRYAGRPNPPTWVAVMIAIRRKTLVVCAQCHRDIHAGTYDGPRLK